MKLKFKMSTVKPINRSHNTQLSTIPYDTSKIILDEPIAGNIPGSTIQFFRINIGTRNANKTEGELVFALPKLSTYGVKESLDQNTKVLTGYGAGLCLFDRDHQTDEQREIAQTITNIVEKCKDHLILKDVKKKVKKMDLDRGDLKKMSPMSFVKDKVTEEPQPDKPVLNVKIIYSKPKKDSDGNDVDGRICTPFYRDDEVDDNGEPIALSPEEFLNKSGMIRAVIKIESIFVGKDIKLQVKILEAAFKTEQRTTKNRFLSFTSSMLRQNLDDEVDDSFQEKEESLEIQVNHASDYSQQPSGLDELTISDDEKEKKNISKKKSNKK